MQIIEYEGKKYQIIDGYIINQTQYVSCISIEDIKENKMYDCKILYLSPSGYEEIDNIEEYEYIENTFKEKIDNE